MQEEEEEEEEVVEESKTSYEKSTQGEKEQTRERDQEREREKTSYSNPPHRGDYLHPTPRTSHLQTADVLRNAREVKVDAMSSYEFVICRFS